MSRRPTLIVAIVLLSALLLAGMFFWWTAKTAGPGASPREPATASRAPAASRRWPSTALRLLPRARADEAAENSSACLEGRVLEWTAQRGVAGAELTFARAGSTFSVSSAADGRFRFVAPAPGLYELAAVEAPGHASFAPTLGHSPMQFHARADVCVRDAVVYLNRTMSCSGSVTDEGGGKVAGVEIARIAIGGAVLAGQRSVITTSDADGAFTLEASDDDLFEGRDAEHAPVYGRARVVGGACEVRLQVGAKRAPELVGALTVAGSVSTREGEPAEGAVVTATLRTLDITAAGAMEGEFGAATLSGAAGEFALIGLAPGSYDIAATLPGYTAALHPSVTAGTSGIVLTLGKGAVLRGQVRAKESGAPVVSFTVIAAPRDGADTGELLTRSVFDSDGEYELRGLAPGAYAVTVLAYGFATPHERRLEVGDAVESLTADFELSRGSRVFGSVKDAATGAPLAQAHVFLEGGLAPEEVPAPVVARGLTDDKGSFEVAGVGAGLRSISAAAPEYHTRIVSGLDVQPDADFGPVVIDLNHVAPGEQPGLELTGIGATLRQLDGALAISQVFAGGGAQEAGLVAGDAITAIDGRDVGTLEFPDAVELIRGVEGTSLRLAVVRAGETTAHEVTVYRRRVRAQR